jgi:hypothetical chaperone protein
MNVPPESNGQGSPRAISSSATTSLSSRRRNYCAIDFGTSNSAIAIAVATAQQPAGSALIALEGEQLTMPSAVFYDSEDGNRLYGRAAIKAYVDGHPGRLMRSLKSILGSALIEETTQLGDGIALRYIDVVAGFLKQLKDRAEQAQQDTLEQVVLGRPVYFVDDDSIADRRAEQALEDAARSIGFKQVSFQFEPIAAALNYQQRLTSLKTVLVADIGGGTSDFTVMRLGAPNSRRAPHQVLASHGVHIAGTDFDQRVELEAIMPSLGFRSKTPEGREVPNRIYYDLATWHLINSVYAPRRVAQLRAMKHFYADQRFHKRLLKSIEQRLGHQLVARAEQAKIDLSFATQVALDLSAVETGLLLDYSQQQLADHLAGPLALIVAAAQETVRRAGIDDTDIDTLYFTGGSTGLQLLSEVLTRAFGNAEAVHGDRFASVASGLGIEAERRYGPAPAT